MELPLNGQIRIQDRGGNDITQQNWEIYHRLRDEGSVWFIITLVEDGTSTTSTTSSPSTDEE